MVALLVAACSDRKYVDEGCYNPRPPWGTEPYVGLFHRDGRPAYRNARVWVTYDGMTTQLRVNPRLAAELFPNGRQAYYLALPPDRPGNLFTFYTVPGGVIAMYPCALPLHYRVEAEGCARVEGSWSWNDNTWPDRPDYNFHIPVRLDCTGDDLPPDASTPGDAAHE